MKDSLVKRAVPANLSADDIILFEHELIKKIPHSKIGKYRNIYIFNNRFYKFRYFEYLSKHWKMNEYKLINKLKIFIKNFIYILGSREKQKTINIKKGIYFTDEKAKYYFHWLFDSVQRLEYICNSKININEYEILIDQNLLEYNFIVKVLKIYDIKYTILKNNISYRVEELIVPYHLANSGNYNIVFLNKFRNRLRNYFKNQNKYKKKIWISRQNSRIRKIKNFEEVEKVLIKYGFEIIEAEKLDFFDQAKIFVNSEVIGSIHGGGLSNMIFMDKFNKVIEVRGKNDNLNNCYFSLASGLDLSYYYFLSEVENDDFYHSDYFIDIFRFEEFLKNYFS